MFRTADGGSEQVSREIGSDVGWFALNLGDGNSWEDSDYVRLRQNAQLNGVAVLPWARLWDPDDLFGLMWQAEQIGEGRVLLNIENEFQTELTPQVVADLLVEFPNLDVGISTVGWVYNDVDFRPLAHIPFLLQIFPTDMKWSVSDIEQKTNDCISHARDGGIVYCGTTIQTYGDASPEWFSFMDWVRSYYTGDDIGIGGWRYWRPAV